MNYSFEPVLFNWLNQITNCTDSFMNHNSLIQSHGFSRSLEEIDHNQKTSEDLGFRSQVIQNTFRVLFCSFVWILTVVLISSLA